MSKDFGTQTCAGLGSLFDGGLYLIYTIYWVSVRLLYGGDGLPYWVAQGLAV